MADDKQSAPSSGTSQEDSDTIFKELGLTDEEIAELEREVEEETKKETPPTTPPKKEGGSRASERIRELVRQNNELKKSVVSPETISQIAEKIVQEKLQEHDKKLSDQQKIAKLEDEIGALEKKYSGDNGLPKFSREEILKYGEANNIFNPEAAYQHKYSEEIIAHRVKSGKVEKPDFTRQGGTTPKDKEEPTTSLGDGSFARRLAEKLSSK